MWVLCLTPVLLPLTPSSPLPSRANGGCLRAVPEGLWGGPAGMLVWDPPSHLWPLVMWGTVPKAVAFGQSQGGDGAEGASSGL